MTMSSFFLSIFSLELIIASFFSLPRFPRYLLITFCKYFNMSAISLINVFSIYSSSSIPIFPCGLPPLGPSPSCCDLDQWPPRPAALSLFGEEICSSNSGKCSCIISLLILLPPFSSLFSRYRIPNK